PSPLFFHPYANLQHLPSFPTRRSSDLSTALRLEPSNTLLCGSSNERIQSGVPRRKAIATPRAPRVRSNARQRPGTPLWILSLLEDRKSTRLNSSHSQISYAVFCLKKKN